jgi:hypothetical protein
LYEKIRKIDLESDGNADKIMSDILCNLFAWSAA